jgi:hypothetical protein
MDWLKEDFGKCGYCSPSYGGLGYPVILCERHAAADAAPIQPPLHPMIEDIRKRAIKDRLALVFAQEKIKVYEKWQGSWIRDRARVRDWLRASGLWERALVEGAVEEDGPALA